MSDQALKCYYSIVTGAVLPDLTLEDALTFSTLNHIRSITRQQFTSPFYLREDNTSSPLYCDEKAELPLVRFHFLGSWSFYKQKS